MAKRARKSKASATPALVASVQPAQAPAARPARKSAAKPARKAVPKRKTSTRKRISSAERRTLLAEAKSKGWTAEQIAKKAGVSKWTVYGWKKRGAKPATAKRGRPGRKAATSAQKRVSGALRDDFREMIAGIVRVEVARLVGG